MMEQFGIKDSGAVVYKPKRSKYLKIDSVSVEDVKKVVESAVSGGSQDGW